MSFHSLLNGRKWRWSLAPTRGAGRGAAPRRRAGGRLCVEPLEDRCLLSAYLQTNLAADQPGVALIHDPELVDAWGISLNPNGTFWVSARATNVSTVYSGDVTRPDGTRTPFVKSALTVTIPGGSPTGQIFNPSTDFVVSAGGASRPATFIFASETGHITGWNANVPLPSPPPSRNAFIMATTPGAVYTGLAIGNNGTGNFLYAADFRNGEIDVFDRTYTPTTLAGAFVDPAIPDDYAPFNIWNLAGQLYVAYARQVDGDALPDGGHGFVSVFDTNGNLLSHLVDDSHLKEPWGLALAPGNFGEFSNALLVANTANGKINAYHATTGAFLGRLADATGEALHIHGLWGLHFGNGTVSGDRNALYFSAVGKKHKHGLFGSLRLAPEAAARMGGSAERSRDTGKDAWSSLPIAGADILVGLAPGPGEVMPGARPASNGPLLVATGADRSPPGQLPADTVSLIGGWDVDMAAAGDEEQQAALDRLFALDANLGAEALEDLAASLAKG
jgi:uncharacterized protein (TIGR03118 family)